MVREVTLTKSLLRLYSHISLRRRWQLVGLIVLMFIGAVAEMATLGAVVPFLALLADPSVAKNYPILQKLFAILGGKSGNMLLSAALLFCVIAVGAALVRMLLMWVSLRISFGLGADIGGEVYLRTLYQPYSWHVSHNSSEILAGIDKVNAVVWGTLTPLLQAVVALVMSIGILIMLLAIDPQTAIIAGVGFSMLYGLTSLYLRRRVEKNGQIVADSVTHRVQAIQEGLGGIRDVLLDGTQPIYFRRFAGFDYAMRRAQAALGLIGASPRYIIEATGMILIVGLAYWLSERQYGLIGAIPVLGALAVGAQKLLPQMQLVYTGWSSVNGNRSQLNDVLDLLERPIPSEYAQTISDAAGSKDSFQSKYATPLIALRNVSFRYKAKSAEVLHDINLEIPKGARIGLIGKTGSGKSTLIDLIMGLLDPTIGQIEIDGQPINDSNRRAWQHRIAHVPQSIYLSDTSIAENIAFGIPLTEIDLAKVKDAAMKAQLASFIDTLPQQYQTPVGERGVRLSGGQRQRIGLARALYKQTDVLILDEATSALDDATERSIMTTIKELGDELTVLMIAHRVSTLQDCDQIIELGNKTILRTGSYCSLIDSIPAPHRSDSHTIKLKHA